MTERTTTPDDLDRGPDRRREEPDRLGPEECMRLIAPGGVGRVAFDEPEGPAVLPVNYAVHNGVVVFRTAFGGPLDDGLRTGVRGAEFKVAFEVDRIDETAREGWSVLIRGAAHHVEAGEEPSSDVEPWAGGDRGLYVTITPAEISGRRVRHG
ncbi:pyridoxamine 5'-phosphate oxidase family protein [Streptosporangium sp. NPDC001559]|uniref:pyridoxamine 5'-phosphate oxidase family protein n=1 Tax=Streptosporangium sp. NPDC001559 TaxID=3366187 RepID=UPI0036E71609